MILTNTNRRGQRLLAPVAAGRYFVEARRGELRSDLVPVDVVERERSEVRLVARPRS